MGAFRQELLAIQTWLKQTAGLNSYLEGTAAINTRPVAAFEAPSNINSRNITNYQYVKTKRQYCRLYINDVGELLDIQEKLILDLEERCGTIEVLQNGGVAGKLKNAKITFHEAESKIVPFDIEYEATYSRTRPKEAPPARTVITKRTPRFD